MNLTGFALGSAGWRQSARTARRRNEQSALRQRTRLRRESRLAAAQHQLEAAKALAQFEAAEAEAERWAAANAKRDQPQQPEEHGVGAQPQPHGQGQTQSFGTHSHAPSGAQQLLLAAQKMHEATASALKHDAQGQGQDRGHGKVPGRNIARPTTPPYFPLRSNLPPPEPDPERESLQRARDRAQRLERAARKAVLEEQRGGDGSGAVGIPMEDEDTSSSNVARSQVNDVSSATAYKQHGKSRVSDDKPAYAERASAKNAVRSIADDSAFIVISSAALLRNDTVHAALRDMQAKRGPNKRPAPKLRPKLSF